jgi:hypothetical protein
MATHYLPTPMSAEEAQTLAALAVLSGKSRQQLLKEIVSAALQRPDLVIAVAPLLSKPRMRAILAKDLEDSRVTRATA